VVQIYGFNDVRKWLEKEEGQKRTGAARDFSKVPVLLYEQKISLEAIDVLKWSPDDNFLAAGSHDNYVYVLGKTVPGGSDAESAWKALGLCRVGQVGCRRQRCRGQSMHGLSCSLDCACAAYACAHILRHDVDRTNSIPSRGRSSSPRASVHATLATSRRWTGEETASQTHRMQDLWLRMRSKATFSRSVHLSSRWCTVHISQYIQRTDSYR
jgi:hypothetical protein